MVINLILAPRQGPKKTINDTINESKTSNYKIIIFTNSSALLSPINITTVPFLANMATNFKKPNILIRKLHLYLDSLHHSKACSSKKINSNETFPLLFFFANHEYSFLVFRFSFFAILYHFLFLS